MGRGIFQEVNRLKPGDHCLLIHDGLQEQINVLVPFIKLAFDRNEKCMVLLDQYSQNLLEKRLNEDGVNVRDEKLFGRLCFFHSRDAYLQDGVFEPEKIINLWSTSLNQALKEGYTALRIAGETNWAVENKKNLVRLLDYETKSGDFIFDSKCLVLCLYERRLFAADALMTVLNFHPLFIHHGHLRINTFFKGHSYVNRGVSKSQLFDHHIREIINYGEYEHKIQAFHDDYTSLVCTIPGVVYRMLYDGSIKIISEYVEKITGYPREYFYQGRLSWLDIIHPEDREGILNQDYLLMYRQGEAILTYRVIRRDKKVLWVQDVRRAIFVNGRFAFADGIIFDINENKEVEEELKESEEKYRRLFENESDAVMIFDTETLLFEDANEAALNLFGYTKEEFLTLTLVDISADKKESIAIQEDTDSVPGNKYTTVRHFSKKDGTVFPGEIYSGTFTSRGRNKIIGAIRDITERQLAEERFRLTVENSTDAIILVDEDSRKIVYANSSAMKLFGYAMDELIGLSITEIVDPCQVEEQSRSFTQLKAEETINISDRIVVRKDGSKVHTDMSVFFIPSNGRKIAVARLRDMTERRDAVEEISRLKTMYEAITLSIPSAIILHDPEFRVTFVNDRFTQLTGLSREEVLDRSPLEYLPAEVVEYIGLKEKLSHIRKRKMTWGPEEITYRTAAGVEFIFRYTIYPLFNREKMYGVMALLDDVTEERRAKRALHDKTMELDQLNKDLRDLIVEITRLEEKERKQFSDILHEGIGQNLVAIKMALAGCMKALSPENEEARETMCYILSLLDRTIHATRSMTVDLYPSVLDDIGLLSAVRWYTKKVLEPNGIDGSLYIDEAVDKLPDEPKRCVFRIIRECFQNILKHSNASKVEVECRNDNGLIRLKVKDNGVGFRYRGIKNDTGRTFGLRLIREWAESMNGHLKIQPQLGRGTEVIVEFPLPV